MSAIRKPLSPRDHRPRNNASLRWLAWLFVVLLVASFASGCGGDEGGDSSATEWADGVCSAITSWTESITSTADSLRSGNLSEDTVRDAVDDAGSATSDFVDDLRGLGTPDTEAGEQARESVDQLADDADEAMSEIQSAVDDAKGLSGLVGAVTAVSGIISTMGDRLTSTVTELRQLDPGGELESAFREAGSCDELQSS